MTVTIKFLIYRKNYEKTDFFLFQICPLVRALLTAYVRKTAFHERVMFQNGYIHEHTIPMFVSSHNVYGRKVNQSNLLGKS